MDSAVGALAFAEAFRGKVTPRKQEWLRGGNIPQQTVALLGIIAIDRLAAIHFPSRKLRKMLREAAGETVDPEERERLRPLFGPDLPGETARRKATAPPRTDANEPAHRKRVPEKVGQGGAAAPRLPQGAATGVRGRVPVLGELSSDADRRRQAERIAVVHLPPMHASDVRRVSRSDPQ